MTKPAALTAEMESTLAELEPFIVRRLRMGYAFEQALRMAPSDAHMFAQQNSVRILDAVYSACNAEAA